MSKFKPDDLIDWAFAIMLAVAFIGGGIALVVDHFN